MLPLVREQASTSLKNCLWDEIGRRNNRPMLYELCFLFWTLPYIVMHYLL